MTEIKREPYYSHFGADKKMRRSAIVDMMQDCCTISRQEDEVIGGLMRSGALLYVAFRQLDLISEPEYREELTVRTQLFESRRVYGRRVTDVYGGGELRARSYLISTLVDGQTRKPLTIPKELDDRIVLGEQPEMEFTPRKIRIPSKGGRKAAPFPAMKCQADTNGHINNARYFDLGDELLPDGAVASRIRCEYKASFMPGELIIPTAYDTAGGTVIVFSNEAGEICSVMEYIFR